MKNINNLYFLTLEGFNKITDSQEMLKENEILMVDPKGKKYEKDRLEILDFDFQVKKTLSAAQVEKLIGPTAVIAYESYFIKMKKKSEPPSKAYRKCMGKFAVHGTWPGEGGR
ncbi:MAG: hypothetical protein ACI4EO_00660, partial [Blautia sp.]